MSDPKKPLPPELAGNAGGAHGADRDDGDVEEDRQIRVLEEKRDKGEITEAEYDKKMEAITGGDSDKAEKPHAMSTDADVNADFAEKTDAAGYTPTEGVGNDVCCENCDAVIDQKTSDENDGLCDECDEKQENEDASHKATDVLEH